MDVLLQRPFGSVLINHEAQQTPKAADARCRPRCRIDLSMLLRAFIFNPTNNQQQKQKHRCFGPRCLSGSHRCYNAAHAHRTAMESKRTATLFPHNESWLGMAHGRAPVKSVPICLRLYDSARLCSVFRPGRSTEAEGRCLPLKSGGS